jgi:hypothetical protein
MDMQTGAGELGTPKVLAPLPPQAKTAKLTPFGYMPVTDGASVIPMPAQNWDCRGEHPFTVSDPSWQRYGGVFLSNDVMPFLSMSGAFKIVWAHCAPMTAEEKAKFDANQAKEKAERDAVKAEEKAERDAIKKAKLDAKKAEQQAKREENKARNPTHLSLIYPDEKHLLILKAIFKLEEEGKETNTHNITTTVNEIYGAVVVNAEEVRSTMRTTKHKTCLERARAARAQDDVRD